MTGPVFADANVLVYARDGAERAKQPVAASWLAYLWQHRIGRLSVQVLQEFYVTATQKLRPPVPETVARADVRALYAWNPAPMDAALVESAFGVQDDHSVSWWDALIVAAAQAARCRYLLTEDLQDGAQFGAVTVVNPFAHTPDSLA